MKALLAALVVLVATTAPALAAGRHDLDVTIDGSGFRSTHPARYAVSKPIHVHVHAASDAHLEAFSMVIDRAGASPIPVALQKTGADEYTGDVKLPAAGTYDVAMTAQVGGVRYPAPPVVIEATSAPLANMPVRTVAVLASVPFLGALAGLFFFRKSKRGEIAAV
jgi:hypothetical protein